MVKIAIVGTSRELQFREYFQLKKQIKQLLASYIKLETIILSGGAKGVDTIAVTIAANKGFQVIVRMPEVRNWEGFKKRNLEIANECDELYCFTLETKERMCYHHTPHGDHEKTAGCWTMNEALKLGKPCKLIVIKNE